MALFGFHRGVKSVSYLIYPVLLLLAVSGRIAGEAGRLIPGEVQKLQAIADEFRARLRITQRVRIRVVVHDKRLVSVRKSPKEDDVFILSIDQNFLRALSPEEVRAAIAHEFGHIWIFTHHPYLHTEELANRIALQLVSQDSVKSVYLKVAQFGGMKQELPSVTSPPREAGLAEETPLER
ncbi:MAG TPA: hypothetical protein PLP42_18670 [Acidobacteriota bacterium]|nr:hypothetical protein [Acidobacteriota bacterium]